MKNLILILTATIFLGGVGYVAFSEKTIERQSEVKGESQVLADLVTYIDYSDNIKFQNEKIFYFLKPVGVLLVLLLIETFLAELDQIPQNVTIYRVNFEEEKELRDKYDVASQHTFVQVDSEGNELKQWYGSYNINEVLEEII